MVNNVYSDEGIRTNDLQCFSASADPRLFENERGLVLANEILTVAGFSVTSSRNLEEFAMSLPLGDYAAVVTISTMIDDIVPLTGLPIFDIQSFITRGEDGVARATFDRASFLLQLRSSILARPHQRVLGLTG